MNEIKWIGMKTILTILFFFVLIHSNAQSGNGNFFREWSSSNTVMSLEYGVAAYQIHQVNNAFADAYNKRFSNHLGVVGLSVSEPSYMNKKYAFDLHVDYGYYHSTPVVYEENDSTRYAFGGFHLGLSACKDLFPQRKSVDVLIGIGFNAGRILFGNWDLTVEKKENRHNRYRNPFFAPKLSIEPRVILFKRLVISVRSEIQFDLTHSKWKQKNENLPDIPGSLASGYTAMAAIGWKF